MIDHSQKSVMEDFLHKFLWIASAVLAVIVFKCVFRKR